MKTKKNLHARTCPPPVAKQSGILLIEVLISILIFSFGILGLVGMQAVASQNAANAESRVIAASMANEITSMMYARKTSNIADANLSADIAAWKTRVAGSTLPNASGDVTVAGDIATITIQWRPPSKTSTEANNKYETQITVIQ